MKYTLLLVWCCLLNTLIAKAQSSILLEPSKDNGIFSKRESALNANNLPISPVILPATGVGTRLMWIPSKSAFRVGTIIDEGYGSAASWDADNIGIYSIAGGINVRATGFASIALGYSAWARGNTSVALGSSIADGWTATAMGLGRALGSASVAGGEYAEAHGEASVSIGMYSRSIGFSSSAFGYLTKAKGDYSLSAGYESSSFGEASIALGRMTSAYKFGGISIGAFNEPGDTTVTYNDTAVDTDRIFQLGNGFYDSFLDYTYSSNAITVLRNGNVGIGNSPATLAPTERLVVDSNISVDGFSKLGSNAPAIKVLKLTGTTAAAQGTYTSIAHGLSLSKILSVEVFVSVSATVKHGRGWTAYGGHQFDFYIDSTVVQILNIAGNSGNILSKPYTVLITYEQ